MSGMIELGMIYFIKRHLVGNYKRRCDRARRGS
jgi:hypothetical protein